MKTFEEIRKLAKQTFTLHGVGADSPIAWHAWKFAFQQGYAEGVKDLTEENKVAEENAHKHDVTLNLMWDSATKEQREWMQKFYGDTFLIERLHPEFTKAISDFTEDEVKESYEHAKKGNSVIMEALMLEYLFPTLLNQQKDE